MLQVEFPGVTMQFTNCEQVQLALGLFAIARQARMGMSKLYGLPGVMTETNVEVQTTMMWTQMPMGAAARDQFTHPVTGKVSPYVRLTIAPLTFALMDTTAIETMVAAMKKAHKLAAATFDDGEEFSRNSAAPRWRPRAQHSYRITGTGWLKTGPPQRTIATNRIIPRLGSCPQLRAWGGAGCRAAWGPRGMLVATEPLATRQGNRHDLLEYHCPCRLASRRGDPRCWCKRHVHTCSSVCRRCRVCCAHGDRRGTPAVVTVRNHQRPRHSAPARLRRSRCGRSS